MKSSAPVLGPTRRRQSIDDDSQALGQRRYWKGHYLREFGDDAIGAFVSYDPHNIFHLNHNIPVGRPTTGIGDDSTRQ